jgi:hypothetical protein
VAGASNQHLFSKKGKTTVKIKTNVKAGKVGDPGCPEWGCGMNHNQTAARGLKVKTNVKAGKHGECPIITCGDNHNQTVSRGLKVRTNVKAGEMQIQYNQTATRGLKVKTGVKAGPGPTPIIRD